MQRGQEVTECNHQREPSQRRWTCSPIGQNRQRWESRQHKSCPRRKSRQHRKAIRRKQQQHRQKPEHQQQIHHLHSRSRKDQIIRQGKWMFPERTMTRTR
mgnify:CR=1 FL=1